MKSNNGSTNTAIAFALCVVIALQCYRIKQLEDIVARKSSPFTLDRDGWWVADDAFFLFSKGIVVGPKNPNCQYGNAVMAVSSASPSYEPNCPSGDGSVAFGADNVASGEHSAVLGGGRNVASGVRSSVAGGVYNRAEADDSSVLGGLENSASGDYAAVLGGYENSAEGWYSAVLGGEENSAQGYSSAIIGGNRNVAGGYNAVAVAGYENSATGDYSSVDGGRNNSANLKYGVTIGNVAESSLFEATKEKAGSKNVVTKDE
uniref:Trimeric autotransporter adhesin YadA-like head domain-containing protein n=1 Tax=Corethron hystrix TaxID=216773 RepID=A0A6U5JPF7_9STRA|mmetsp:Transcript_37982/g.88364  ORF Transcript_37982/g.88364 Transcript_37982/m.88364 type:complete len:261 (+) Transcript_37982:176-958(+)